LPPRKTSTSSDCPSGDYQVVDAVAVPVGDRGVADERMVLVLFGRVQERTERQRRVSFLVERKFGLAAPVKHAFCRRFVHAEVQKRRIGLPVGVEGLGSEMCSRKTGGKPCVTAGGRSLDRTGDALFKGGTRGRTGCSPVDPFGSLATSN
jgi:hypothetical protein